MYWLGRLAVAAIFLAAGPAWGLSDPAGDGQVRVGTRDNDGPVYFERGNNNTAIEDGNGATPVERENGQVEIERQGKAERGMEKAGRATDKALDTAGRAVGKGLEKAGEGMNRAGEWMQEHGD